MMFNKYVLMPTFAVAILLCASPSIAAQPTQIKICIQNNYSSNAMFACQHRYLDKTAGYQVGTQCSSPINTGQVVENLTYQLNQKIYICGAAAVDSAFADCTRAQRLTVTQGGLYTFNWNGSLTPPDPVNGTPCPAQTAKK